MQDARYTLRHMQSNNLLNDYTTFKSTCNNLETEDTVRGTHGRLDVETLNLLPILGEERNEEVDGEGNVGNDLLLGHADVGDSDTKAESLLRLKGELNGSLGTLNLVSDILVGTEDRGELTGLVKTRTHETRNHTNESGRGEESIVRVGELLDELLVLLELLQVILGHGGDTSGLSALNILGITNNADRELLLGGDGEADNTGKTLVLDGVVVLQSDLELDGLDELALLLTGVLQNGGDSLLHGIVG